MNIIGFFAVDSARSHRIVTTFSYYFYECNDTKRFVSNVIHRLFYSGTNLIVPFTCAPILALNPDEQGLGLHQLATYD